MKGGFGDGILTSHVPALVIIQLECKGSAGTHDASSETCSTHLSTGKDSDLMRGEPEEMDLVEQYHDGEGFCETSQ